MRDTFIPPYLIVSGVDKLSCMMLWHKRICQFVHITTTTVAHDLLYHGFVSCHIVAISTRNLQTVCIVYNIIFHLYTACMPLVNECIFIVQYF